MSSRGRDYDRHSSTRHRSRSGAFLDALGEGHFGDALGALKPGSTPTSGDYHRPRRDMIEKPRRRSHYDDYLSDDDYYYEDTRPHRRQRSTHTDRRGSDRKGRDKTLKRASTGPNLRQAAEAAIAAGAVEAWRSRNDRDRTTRVATAAIGAAATDALLGRDSRRTTKRHLIESVVAGLAENRVVNGSRR
ncbi:hypothetical protein F4819DRAFT_145702 [Hypoxylon fuscum]|nr:hypothetical protein F4819DRAFT_145702 [Hypoxylon fuscum]